MWNFSVDKSLFSIINFIPPQHRRISCGFRCVCPKLNNTMLQKAIWRKRERSTTPWNEDIQRQFDSLLLLIYRAHLHLRFIPHYLNVFSERAEHPQPTSVWQVLTRAVSRASHCAKSPVVLRSCYCDRNGDEGLAPKTTADMETGCINICSDLLGTGGHIRTANEKFEQRFPFDAYPEII